MCVNFKCKANNIYTRVINTRITKNKLVVKSEYFINVSGEDEKETDVVIQ